MKNAFLICFLCLGFCVESHGSNWPQWRGPSFNGSTTVTNQPSLPVGTNILWKTSLPGASGATPAVWGNRAFVSSLDSAGKEVLALGVDLKDGRLLWQRPVGTNRTTVGPNNMASPSPVTDGKRVCFLTGNGALSAFDMEGKPLWKRNLAKDYGEFVEFYGYSSSPLLWDGKLYIVAIQNTNACIYNQNPGWTEPLDSYLLALDPVTGKTLWKQIRNVTGVDAKQSQESYVTPQPLEWNSRREILLLGAECMTGHDAASGAELWRWWFTPKDREIYQHAVPTPVTHEGLIYVIRPEHRPLYAVRAGGTGELAEEQIAWTWQTNKAWIASPLVHQGRLYVRRSRNANSRVWNPKPDA